MNDRIAVPPGENNLPVRPTGKKEAGRRWKPGVALWLIFLVGAPALASGGADGERPSVPLDDQLLEDLDRELGRITDQPTELEQAVDKQIDAAVDALDRQAPDRPRDGEDLAKPGAENPLADIERRMRLVENKIGNNDVSALTQRLQDAIVDDLDALIQQCKKQCKPCLSSGQTKSAGQSDKPGRSAATQSQLAARDSTDRLENDEPRQASVTSMQALIKETWGHLPARLREPMLNSGVEQFLPKYQQVIEDYFRRLAEDTDATP